MGTDSELKEKSVSKDLRFSKTERMNSVERVHSHFKIHLIISEFKLKIDL